jgi:hypothetical protein
MRRLLIVAAIVVVASGVLFWLLPAAPSQGEPPLLNGPPEFIILSLLAALALYLRQVNLNAVDVRYKMRHGELWNAPPEKTYRAEKIKQLQWTSDTILRVSPFMFALILLVCGRIGCDCLRRFYSASQLDLLYHLDFLIVVWLSLTFVGLTIAHFVVRHKDGEIQEKIRTDDK